MTDPFSFTATTARLHLPNLFSAQAQKEIIVNEGFARLDALLHPVIEGEADDPPPNPVDGECWIVGVQPSGDWSLQAGKVACRQAGNWLFVDPVQGMTVFDNSASRIARFDAGWHYAVDVPAPSGGTTEDAEARTAILGLIAALQSAGILAEV